MSAPPRRSSRVSSAPAPESAAAASSASAGSKRRAGDAALDSATPGTIADPQHPTVATMSDADAAPSSSLQSASASAAAHFVSSASVASAVAHKKQKRAGAAISAPSTAASAVAAPSRWSTIYSDALHSILKFASLADLSRVLAVSRRWTAAVNAMPSIHATSIMGNALAFPCSRAQTRRGKLLLDRLHSRLARHVSSFGESIPSLAHLQLIAQRMPWLRELLFTPTSSQPFCAALATFKDLRILSLDRARMDSGDSDAVIVAASQLSKLDTLRLGLSRVGISAVNFAPLSALHSLLTLELQSDKPCDPASDAQIVALRSLSSLTEFYARPWVNDHTFLVRLLQPGHFFQWKQLQRRTGRFLAVHDPLALLIGSLSALTTLEVTVYCSNVSFLAHLLHLTQLILHCVEPVDTQELVAALSHCTQLCSLDLMNCPLTSEQLATLLPHFPRLREFGLWGSEKLNSLSWLAIPAMQSSLQVLSLHRVPLLACTPSECAHLLGLRSLDFLHLRELGAPLSDALKAEITSRFPALKRLVWA